MTVADHLTLSELERVKKAGDPVEKARSLAVYHAKEIGKITRPSSRWCGSIY